MAREVAASIKRGLEQAVAHAQDPNETIAHNSPSGATTLAPPRRGLEIDVCDQGHQAIAFAGSCPLCRLQPRYAAGARPLEEGNGIYASDLERLLAAKYAHR